MKIVRLFAVLLIYVVVTPLFAQDATEAEIHRRDRPADANELAAITERGRAIAGYDKAAWYGTDEVMALHPKAGSFTMYIGRLTSSGWVIGFGKLNDKQDAFLLSYEATPTLDYKHPSIKSYDPAIVDRIDWLPIARSLEHTRRLVKASRPYNGAVISAPHQEWYVYFYPAQTTFDSFPMGGDFRFRVSGDGTKVLETRKMHVRVLEMDMTHKSPDQATFHTAVLDDAPEDTDVADVLMMGGIPMTIFGEKFAYQIAPDGTLKYVMTTQAYKESQSPSLKNAIQDAIDNSHK